LSLPHADAVDRSTKRLERLKQIHDRLCYLKQAEEEIYTRLCVLQDQQTADLEEWGDIQEMKEESDVRQHWIKAATAHTSTTLAKEEQWQKSLILLPESDKTMMM